MPWSPTLRLPRAPASLLSAPPDLRRSRPSSSGTASSSGASRLPSPSPSSTAPRRGRAFGLGFFPSPRPRSVSPSPSRSRSRSKSPLPHAARLPYAALTVTPKRRARRHVLSALYAILIFAAAYRSVAFVIRHLSVTLAWHETSPPPSSFPIARTPDDGSTGEKMGPAWTQPPLKPLLSDLLDRSSRSRSKSKSRPKSKKTTNKKKQKPGSSPQSPLAAASSSSSHPPPESHVDLPSGLLLANPSAPQHPLHALIASAERAWSATLARQSKSLDEAAAEYRRRYGGRAPPRGFDRWWDYVEAHDVRLPDEYDQIEDDLATFRALSPRQLQEIVGAWEGHKETFTIGKLGSWRGAGINIVNATLNGGPGDPNWEMHVRGARALIALLKDVEQWIPPFRAVFSPHDNPNLLASWRLREEAKKAVAEGRYLDIHDLPPHENIGWLSACAPTSPARALATPFPPSSESYETSFPDLSAPNRTRTFVRSHLAAMDPCTHPSLFTSHGQFLSHHAGPGLESPPLVPQFSYSTSAAHADLRPAGVGGWVEDVEGDLGWEEKERRDEEEAGRGGERRAGKLLWRGSNTGIWCGGDHRWWEAQRERLVMMAEEGEGVVSLMVANSSSSEGEGQGQGWRGEGQGWHVVEVERRALRDALLDVHFAGGPMQCAEEVCPVLEDMFDWRENMDTREAGRYKYVMDVDGNGWSSRFKRLITSHAVVLKATVYPEWFSRRIQPWVHFVPVKNDYSDVMDIMAFFTGYGGGEDNDHLARKIAEAGREWSRTMWRKEDLTAYMFRMLLEYARLMSLDRDQMDFQDIEDQW